MDEQKAKGEADPADLQFLLYTLKGKCKAATLYSWVNNAHLRQRQAKALAQVEADAQMELESYARAQEESLAEA